MGRQRRFKLSLPLLWDGLMVYLAIINVLFIGFDFTYLWFRAFYVTHVPWIARNYDPVKGIEPYPATLEYLQQVDATRALLERSAPAAEIQAQLDELQRLSVELVDENPFVIYRPVEGPAAIAFWIVTEAGYPPVAAVESERIKEAFRAFWSYDPQELPQRLALFDEKIRPIMAPNYFRVYDPDSLKFKDWSWLIDLPFLLLFATEFFVRWGIAIRRHTHKAWYLFPLFNWYDALGLIPYFRIFRLFRVVSIYLRLHRSEMTAIGQDVVSRTVKYVVRVIAEEITDLVTLRILDATQAKVQKGVYAEVFHKELAERKDVLRDGVVRTLRDVAGDGELRESVREFLRLNLDQSVASAPALRGIPLPDPVLRRLVRAVGDAIFDSLVRTVADTLHDERGAELLESIVDEIVDSALADFAGEDLDELVKSIAVAMIERTKESVAVKEWTGEQISKEESPRRAP
jgi:hypothetical protein